MLSGEEWIMSKKGKKQLVTQIRPFLNDLHLIRQSRKWVSISRFFEEAVIYFDKHFFENPDMSIFEHDKKGSRQNIRAYKSEVVNIKKILKKTNEYIENQRGVKFENHEIYKGIIRFYLNRTVRSQDAQAG